MRRQYGGGIAHAVEAACSDTGGVISAVAGVGPRGESVVSSNGGRHRRERQEGRKGGGGEEFESKHCEEYEGAGYNGYRVKDVGEEIELWVGGIYRQIHT